MMLPVSLTFVITTDSKSYEGIDELEKKVIDATYEAYEAAVNRPLFDEFGQVWATWQNALLSWSDRKSVV